MGVVWRVVWKGGMEGGREGGREGGMEGVGCSLDRDHSCIASQTVCRTLPLLCVSMCMCVWSNTQCIAVCTYTRALSPCSPWCPACLSDRFAFVFAELWKHT